MERGTDNMGSESLSHGLFAMDLSPSDSADLPATANAQCGSVAMKAARSMRAPTRNFPPEYANACNPARAVAFRDALTYVVNVRELQSQSYRHFLAIRTSVERGDLDTPGTVDRIPTLLSATRNSFMTSTSSYLTDTGPNAGR